MKLTRRAAIPLMLVVIGVAVLIGCIPIPATRQFQINGKRRPEHTVGTSEQSPVRVGYTHIDDAFIALSRQVTPDPYLKSWRPPALGIWSLTFWSVSPDARRFAIQYQLRTGWLTFPLCFFYSESTSEARWLTLDVDDRGVVTMINTTNQAPGYWPMHPLRWLEIFDEPTRHKLQAAGVLPTDDELERAERAQLRWRTLTTLPQMTPTTR
jgi:hypothetical protein